MDLTRASSKPWHFLSTSAFIGYTFQEKDAYIMFSLRYFGKRLCTKAPLGVALLSQKSLMMQ